MVMDIVGPLILLILTATIVYVVWSSLAARRRREDLDARTRLAEAEARKWEAMDRNVNPNKEEGV